MSGHPFETDLDKNPANYVPLSPLTFIERAAAIYPDYPAVVHGERRYTWAESYARCRRLASALNHCHLFVNTATIIAYCSKITEPETVFINSLPVPSPDTNLSLRCCNFSFHGLSLVKKLLITPPN